VISNLHAFAVLLSYGLLGGLANWLLYQRNVPFMKYLSGEFLATCKSSGGIIALALGYMNIGTVDIDSPVIFSSMFAAGFAIDKVLNKPPANNDIR
jgi:hypothetical protein